jgi:hypothetical protein
MITATPRRRRPVRIGLVQLSVRFRTSVRIELKRSGNLQTETPTKHATRHVRAMIEWGIRTGSVALAALMVCPGKSPLNGLSSRDRRLVVFDLSGIYGTPAHVDGHGVSFTFVTSRDSVHFSLLSDPHILENPDLLKRYVVEATAVLVTLASDSRVPA